MSTITRKDLKKRQPKSAMQKRLRYYYKGGRQIYRDVSYLKGLLNVEFKFKDLTGSTLVIGNTTATAQYILLNGLSRGTNANERVGRTIKVKSIQMYATIRLNDACAPGTENNVRVALIYMRDTDGLTPTYSGGTYRSIYINDTVNAMRDLTNRDKFVVLRTWQIALNAEGVKSRNIKYYRKFNLKTVYSATTAGDVSDISKGSFWLVVIGDTNLANPDETWLNYNARMRYIDN